MALFIVTAATSSTVTVQVGRSRFTTEVVVPHNTKGLSIADLNKVLPTDGIFLDKLAKAMQTATV